MILSSLNDRREWRLIQDIKLRMKGIGDTKSSPLVYEMSDKGGLFSEPACAGKWPMIVMY